MDLDCAYSLQCVAGVCRLANCPDQECPPGAFCIDGQCCDHERCCAAFEGPTGDPTCTNGIDDDCDGLTDDQEADCYSECDTDADCADTDPCTLDVCVDHQCEHHAIQNCCYPTGAPE